MRMSEDEYQAFLRRRAFELQETEGRAKYGGPSASRLEVERTVPAKRADREHEEQRALVEWAAVAVEEYPELELLFAIPNGGARTKRTAGRLKAEGVKRGVPDLCLPVPRGPFLGLYVEMKAEGGTVSRPQEWWHDRLRGQGYAVKVCFGQEAAKEALVTYLKLRRRRRHAKAIRGDQRQAGEENVV